MFRLIKKNRTRDVQTCEFTHRFGTSVTGFHMMGCYLADVF
jgi:hypothetical protein